MSEYMFKNKTYFAAANGYNCFRSNFEKIFSLQKLEKLFVIKGGPGTGKSTIMKKLAKEFSNCSDITNILCSSDPGSLDGLILSKNGVSVAIADGTSPHAIEPTYPGAFEDIINLGESFNFEELGNKKNEIINLVLDKKNEYKKAYFMLGVAGDLYEYVSKYLLNNDIYIEAEDITKKIIDCDNNCKYDFVSEDYLVGAFCKDGYKRLSIEVTGKEIIPIKGDGISEYLLMSKIYEILAKEKLVSRTYTSAFSKDLFDAIETKNALIYISYDDAFDSSKIFIASSEYQRIKHMHDSALEEARQCFVNASLYHFKLEDIYSRNIFFEKNESKYEQIKNTIINILFNNN